MAALVLCCGESKGKYFRPYEPFVPKEFMEEEIIGSKNHTTLEGEILCLRFRYRKGMILEKPVNHHVEVLRKGSIVINRTLKDYPTPFRGDVQLCFFEGQILVESRRRVSTFLRRTAAKVDLDGEQRIMRVDDYEKLITGFVKSDNVSEALLYEATIDLMRGSPQITLCGRKKTIHTGVAEADASVTLVSERGLGWIGSCWVCGEFTSGKVQEIVCECRNAAFCNEVCQYKARLTHVCKRRAGNRVTKLWDENSPRCEKCQKEGSDNAPLKRCGGCKKATYCGPECSRAHWRDHKKKCRKDTTN